MPQEQRARPGPATRREREWWEGAIGIHAPWGEDLRWMRDPVAHYRPAGSQQPQPQPRPQGVPRYNLPSINERRWKEVLNDWEEPRRREARRRREVSAARARQEAAKRASAALKEQRQHSARRSNVLAVRRLPAGRRRVTPPLEFTRLIEERASERSGEPSEGLAAETRMGASSQAASAARRGHLGAGGASGVVKPTPVGLLARDFQHFMKISRQQTHAEQHRRYVEEQQRRESEYIMEKHMNAHRRS